MTRLVKVPSLLEEPGDTSAAGGMRQVLSSLVAAGSPPERMVDLLGRT